MSLCFNLRASAFICGPLLLLGCQTTDNAPSDDRKTQNAALNDPYSYGGDMKDVQKPPGKFDDVDPTDISGGGTSTLNKRALQRDMDTVFGP